MVVPIRLIHALRPIHVRSIRHVGRGKLLRREGTMARHAVSLRPLVHSIQLWSPVDNDRIIPALFSVKSMVLVAAITCIGTAEGPDSSSSSYLRRTKRAMCVTKASWRPISLRSSANYIEKPRFGTKMWHQLSPLILPRSLRFHNEMPGCDRWRMAMPAQDGQRVASAS